MQMNPDEVELVIKANMDKLVRVVYADGKTATLFVHSVDDEGSCVTSPLKWPNHRPAPIGCGFEMFVRLTLWQMDQKNADRRDARYATCADLFRDVPRVSP